ncbi:MAG: argininosuccinate lyase [Saprospiraceae bacterium]
MKLWQKDTPLDRKIEDFTVGNDPLYDLELAEYDVFVNLAHARMLTEVGLLDGEEGKRLKQALVQIHASIKAGKFLIEPGIEDVHSQLEKLLTEATGEAGKKIHTARSRNDQVLADLKLYFRERLAGMGDQVVALFRQSMQQAERYQHIFMPGYTHLQVAMPSSFGLWFSAYAENLIDDLQWIQQAFRLINQNPLGSAAGYGSSFPVNRKLTTELLGFERLHINSIHAQMQRGKSEMIGSMAIASLAHTLNKWAYDICLYNGQNFAFFNLPVSMTTGSSIMPHKKNPDVFELIRAKTNQLITVPQQVLQLIQNLPAGYHRDFQLLKEMIFPAFDTIQKVLDLMIYAVGAIEVNENLSEDERYRLAYSVDAVNQLVMQGMSFRDAYHQVGQAVRSGKFQKPEAMQTTHLGSVDHPGLNEIEAKMKEVQNELNMHVPRAIMQSLLD